MTPREERGIVIAAMCRLKQENGEWVVPSQSAEKTYSVNPQRQTCSCPDHLEGGHKCKHLFAVEIVMQREFHPDGSITDTKTVTFTEKKTYRQDWPKYNAAQSVEKDRVQELLFDLCKGLQEPERTCTGRKPHSVRDSIFSMVFKVYSTISARRFSSDLREAHECGYLSKEIPGMKTTAFMKDEAGLLPKSWSG